MNKTESQRGRHRTSTLGAHTHICGHTHARAPHACVKKKRSVTKKKEHGEFTDFKVYNTSYNYQGMHGTGVGPTD